MMKWIPALLIPLLFSCGESADTAPDGEMESNPDSETEAARSEEPEVEATLNAPTLEVKELPEESDYRAAGLSKYTEGFGLLLLATSEVSDDKLLHAATIAAEYIDNDEDGVADISDLPSTLKAKNAAIVMAFDDEATEDLNHRQLRDLQWQDLYAVETNETNSPFYFDASLEEILHIIQNAGYSPLYEELRTDETSALTDAMDIARGGQFMSIPASYPEDSWYHYDDFSCDYECMASEYFYWGLTTLLGAQSNTERCESISHEWELCTPAAMESTDTALTTLLQNSELGLPSRLPDGEYAVSKD